MSGEPLILTIELQLCLVVASTLNGLRNARKTTAAEGNGIARDIRPGQELQYPASIPNHLCAVSSPVRGSSVPARQRRIIL